MSDAADLPEPDRIEGAPHPRETSRLFGQEAAETAFLDAVARGRLHHGWLLTGPRGIGKATLAWRIARFLIAGGAAPQEDGLFASDPAPPTLAMAPDHPVARRVAALSEPGLFLLRRGPNDRGDRLMAEIGVGEVRKLSGFFGLSAAEGGHRVVIVDAADELNIAAANALLKMLEEPPARATLLLISHQPWRLLPTIRSRCRELRLAPLGPDDLSAALLQAGAEAGAEAGAVAELSGGSVGTALDLIAGGGLETYAEVLALLADAPRMDRARLVAFSERFGARGAEPQLDGALRLIDLALARLARHGAGAPAAAEAAPGEHAVFDRLAPTPQAARGWAELQQSLGARARHARAVSLDPSALILDMGATINERAADILGRG